MFQSEDFLKLAKQMTACSEDDELYEARQRSATSRAYYSVFLLARQHKGTPGEGHRKFIKEIKKHKDHIWRSIGDRLETMCDNREDADYEESIKDPKWVADVNIQLADELLKLIHNMPH